MFHYIVILGWGQTDSGAKYWVVLNAWNQWGVKNLGYWGRGGDGEYSKALGLGAGRKPKVYSAEAYFAVPGEAIVSGASASSLADDTNVFSS